MNRNTRKRIGEETVTILNTGHYVSGAGLSVDIQNEVQFTKDNTVLYKPGTFDSIQLHNHNQTEMTVVAGTTLEVAHAYTDNGNVAVLNFASAKNPGGGFLGGSQAQEESLARSSTLYASLMSAWDYYEINRKAANALYTDYIIYSPAVSVIRSEEGALLDEPFQVSMITAPAVNAGALKKNTAALVSEIESVMRQRMRNVFTVAAAHDIDILILGAWGCGVFRNNPNDIARYFVEELTSQRFDGLFKQVIFAIYDNTDGQHILKAFEQAVEQERG